MNLPTDEQVEAYIRAKLAESLTYFNYAALAIEIRGFKDTLKPTLEITLYTSPALGSVRRGSLTSCISHTLELMAKKPESQLLREKAADLIASAERIEAQTGL
jgi:hypothetical protein